MKPLFKIFLIAAMIFVNSCKKDDVASVKDNSAYLKKLELFKQELNPVVRKQMYTLFNPDEKLTFWKDHFLIAVNLPQFNTDERKVTLINLLKSSLTREAFNGNSEARNIALSYTIPAWQQKASGIFSQEELVDLLLYNFQEPAEPPSDLQKRKLSFINTNDDTEPVDAVGCYCHVGNTGYTCKKTVITVGIPTSVSISYGICEQASIACTPGSWGCGFLWFESCNGSHCNY